LLLLHYKGTKREREDCGECFRVGAVGFTNQEEAFRVYNSEREFICGDKQSRINYNFIPIDASIFHLHLIKVLNFTLLVSKKFQCYP
jgi:hypothetical protein